MTINKIILFLYKFYLIQFIYKKIFAKKIVSTSILGQKFIFFRSHYAQYKLGLYEPKSIELFKSIIKKNNLFIDIGANVGLYSMIACIKKAKSICFEPHPETRKLLKKNLLNFDCLIYDYAISNEKKSEKLYISKEPGSHSLKKFSNSIGCIQINTISFDSLPLFQKPDIIKIDVEGAELFVLKGMKKSIAKFHPQFIIEIEEEHLKRFNVKVEEIFNYMRNYKYNYKQIGKEKNFYFF